MTQAHDPAIDTFIERVVDFGSHYQIDRMDTLYSADQSILFVSGEGRTLSMVC
jgi:hypothetical protein